MNNVAIIIAIVVILAFAFYMLYGMKLMGLIDMKRYIEPIKHISVEDITKKEVDSQKESEAAIRVFDEVLKPIIDAYLFDNKIPSKTIDNYGLAASIELPTRAKDLLLTFKECYGLDSVKEASRKYIVDKVPYVTDVVLCAPKRDTDAYPVKWIRIYTERMSSEELLEFKLNDYKIPTNK